MTASATPDAADAAETVAVALGDVAIAPDSEEQTVELSKSQKKKAKMKNKKQSADGAADPSAASPAPEASEPSAAAADDDSGDDAEAQPGSGDPKKKKKKKKKASSGAPTQQTDPPSIPVSKLFPDGRYPEGEWQSYKDDNRWRETSAEKREMERLEHDMVNSVRQAAEVHRQVRACGSD